MTDTITVRAHTRQKPKKIPDPLQPDIDRRMNERLGKKCVEAVEAELEKETWLGSAKRWLEIWKP